MATADSYGQSHRLAGKWGEDNTRDLLRAAKRRGHVYDWIDNLEIQGGDVDHLVIAPSGVFAIDSKWQGVELDELILDRDTKAALSSARRARLILHSERHRDEVTPLLVVWGGSQRQVPEHGIRVHEVLVIRGERLRRWLAYQAGRSLAIERQRARDMTADLLRFRYRVRPGRTR